MIAIKIAQFLINLHRNLKRALMLFLDIIICVISVFLAFGIRSEQWGLVYGYQWLVVLMTVILSLPIFSIFGLYNAVFRYMGPAVLLSLGLAFLLYSLMLGLISWLSDLSHVPRTLWVIQAICYFLGIATSRYLIRYWFSKHGPGEGVDPAYSKSRTLIYGSGVAGRQLWASLSLGRERRSIAGFVDDDMSLVGSTIDGLPVYSLKDLSKTIEKLCIEEILIAVPSANQIHRNEIIENLRAFGVRVRTVPRISDVISGLADISTLYDIDMGDLLGREIVPPNPRLLKKNV